MWYKTGLIASSHTYVNVVLKAKE